MKHIVIIAIILTTMSCGRSVTRNVEKTQTTENTNKQTIDKSKIEITRKADTIVSTKADTVRQSLTPSEMDEAFADGDSVVTKTTKKGSTTLKTSYNKNTKEFSAEAIKDTEHLNVYIDEIEKKQNDITTNVKKDKEISTTIKNVERESNLNWTKVLIWGGVILGGIILIIGLIELPNWNKK